MERMIGLLLVWAVLVAPFVVAAPTAAQVTAQGPAEIYTPTITDQNVEVNAGYVYEANIYSETVTGWWAGLYGQITEKIVLGSGTFLFREWTVTAPTGYVYLTTSTTVDFANLNTTVTTSDVNAALFAQTNAQWMPPADENFESTFEVNATVAANYCTDANAPFTLTYEWNGTAANPVWPTCAYKDPTGVLVLEAKVGVGTSSFKGTPTHFQALVPAIGGATPTPVAYYVWKS